MDYLIEKLKVELVTKLVTRQNMHQQKYVIHKTIKTYYRLAFWF